jgi:hypothetical protein
MPGPGKFPRLGTKQTLSLLWPLGYGPVRLHVSIKQFFYTKFKSEQGQGFCFLPC